jgi:hypothetical protein
MEISIASIIKLEGVWDLMTLTPQQAIEIMRLKSDDEDIHWKLREIQFPIAFGLYTFCSAWHGGQSSELYAIMSELVSVNQLGNVPDELEEDDRYVYDMLETYQKELDKPKEEAIV